MVPVVDLSRRGQRFADAFALAAGRIARSGSFLLGEELAGFEAEFARWTNAPHAVGVSSGAAALQLSLAALGIGPGDEVVVPAFTAVPTVSAVAALGAVAVPADVDAATACVRDDAVQRARTSRTRAVVTVHLYGYPAPLPSTDLPVVEDAAQAHGALTDPVRSAATAYSFYPTKNLGGVGDGGAVVTGDDALAARVRMLRVHGMSSSYVHDEVSQNFRMAEVEAAWLRLALAEVDADVAARRAIAARYRAAAPHLRWQAPDSQHAYHLCVFRAHERDAARAALATAGVATAVHYPLAITQQPAYRHLTRDACPEAEAWAAECVSVPCFPEMSAEEIDTVCTALAGLSA